MIRKDGLIGLPVDGVVVQHAMSIRHQRDARYGNIFKEKETDIRYVGEIGEIMFDHYLRQFREDLTKWLVEGKVTSEPDFIFAGKRIGVKTVKRAVRMKREYLAQITARHIDEPVDYFFFCCFETKSQELVLLGGIDVEGFKKHAVYCPEGTVIHQHYTIRENHEIYQIGVSALTLPDDLIRQILGKYVSHEEFDFKTGLPASL